MVTRSDYIYARVRVFPWRRTGTQLGLTWTAIYHHIMRWEGNFAAALRFWATDDNAPRFVLGIKRNGMVLHRGDIPVVAFGSIKTPVVSWKALC
jgi:hypothetical protein